MIGLFPLSFKINIYIFVRPYRFRGRMKFSVLKVCPENTFRNDGGICISCSNDGFWKTTEEECAKCGTRREMIHRDGIDYCVLKNK